MNTDRGRVHLNERRVLRGFDRYSSDAEMGGYGLPDAPENLDFEELHTEAQAAAIVGRFARGFELRELYDVRAKRLVREASLDCHARFNKPKRPKRKELRASLADIAHVTRRR